MTCCLMCCGCMKFLNRDGSLQTMTGGTIVFSGREINAPQDNEGDGLAFFNSKQEADEFAVAHDWQAVNKAGEEDHRCPSCVKLEHNSPAQAGSYTGAYVEIKDGKFIGLLR